MSEKEIVNSISHWLKFKVPFRVFEFYQCKHDRRMKEIILDHFNNYPHTRGNIIKETESNAKEVFKYLF